MRTLAATSVGVSAALTLTLIAAGGAAPISLMQAEGTSMKPTLHGGVRLVVDLGVEDIEEGDIVVFENDVGDRDRLVQHRAVENTNKGWVTQGDNRPETDQELGRPHVNGSCDCYIGEVIVAIDGNGVHWFGV